MAGLLGTIRGQVLLDIRQAVAAYAALRAQNARTVYALRGTGDAMVATGQTMAVAGGAIVYGFAKMVQAAADFERKMDFFGAVTDTNAAKMEKLSNFTLQLAKDTIYSAGQIADGIIELGKAGVSAEQIIGGIGDAMANLGAAGDIPLAESGQIITSTVQQFDLAARDAIKVTDLLAGAANASIADITDIGVSLKYVGGVANAAGLTFEDTATAISLLAKAGIRGSTAGTSLRQMIVSFGGATGPAREALAEIGILTEDGSNKFYDMQGNLKSLSSVFQILQDATADLTNKQRLMYLRTIFNNRALSAASILTRDGAKGFREMNREMAKTTAADVASKRLDNLSGDIEILRGNIETLMIEQGTPFQETMRGWVRGLTRLVQAFGELDPEMQKMIIQTTALSGVALLLMGAFNIVVGTLLKFIAHMMKLGAGLKFLGRILRIVVVNARWAAVIFGGQLAAALGVTGAMLAVIVVAALAFVAAWVLAYKKIEVFRNAVNAYVSAIWNAVKATGDFIKLLFTDPGKAWDKIKSAVQAAVEWIRDAFSKLPGLISQGLSAAGSYLKSWVDAAVDFFRQLPGQVLGIISGFVSQVLSLLTFRNLGTVVGTVVNFLILAFVKLRVMALKLVLGMVTGLVGLIASLAPKVGYFIGFLVGKVISLLATLTVKAISLTMRMVAGIIDFVAKLPGKVIGFIARLAVGAIAAFVGFVTRLPSMARTASSNIISAVTNLPGTVASIFLNLVSRARSILSRLPVMALNFALGAYNAISDTLWSLPSAVWDAIDSVIQAFRDMVTSGFNAARDFAGGLWNGFKDGLGINSPSFIEKHMVQMNRTMDDETKKLARRTMAIQTLGKKMQNTKFSLGDSAGMGSGNSGLRKLVTDHATNLHRARTLAAASGKRLDRNRAMQSRHAVGSRLVRGELDISPNGRAFLTGVAEDVYYDNDSFEVGVGRMGGN